MMATVRSELLPEFAVQVYPTYEDQLDAQQGYVLMIHDGTLGALELVFPSAQHLKAFLTWTRESLTAARQEAKIRKARLCQPRGRKAEAQQMEQMTLF